MSSATLLFLLLLFSSSSLAANDDIHLIEFKETLRNTPTLDPTWIKGTNPCNKTKPWEGIDCADTNGQAVSSILLMNHGLVGDTTAIDIDALSSLESLRILSLENNTFYGPLPVFNRLTSLRSLFVSGNNFSGEIPPDYFSNMRSLKRVHLSRNNFTGNIPESLVKLENLREVRLQQNNFTGPIPAFQQTMDSIDLSNNSLQGEIPPSMTRYPAKVFDGNLDVCGDSISKPCCGAGATAVPLDGTGSPSHSHTLKWVILGTVVMLLLITILFKAKKKEPTFTVIGDEGDEQWVKVHTSALAGKIIAKKSAQSDIESQPAKKTTQLAAKTSNDLVMINDEKGAFRLPDLMKAAAEPLGSGSLGSAYKATLLNGLSVAVKRIKHMTKLNKDAFDIEVRKFGRVKHRNILPPLAYHYRKEEKLLVSEYMPTGSLLLHLHGGREKDQLELSWPTRLKIIKGVARGMGFLHTEFANIELPHGNLKSSNILLSPNYEPFLTDYAFYSLMNSNECIQVLAAGKAPEAELYQLLTHKNDVFCLGVVILEIMTRKFPSQYFNGQKGGTDVVLWVKNAVSENRATELVDPEISSDASKDELDRMAKMMEIGVVCTESDPEQRIEMREAIRSIEEIQN